jgi:hypothetical protein
MIFDLSMLLQPTDNLVALEEPFTTQEIDSIVKGLPSNKSPGPDGFNTDFLKKCWPTTAQDFYDLCNRFYNEEICMRSINGSYITLIPKKDAPVTVMTIDKFLY